MRNPPFYTPFGVRWFGTRTDSGASSRLSVDGFYTPFGVRWFGTIHVGAVAEKIVVHLVLLYALRREVVRNEVPSYGLGAATLVREFLYALRREVVRNSPEAP